MIKILYVHHSGGFSGAAKSVELLISKLDRSKYHPTVLMLEDGPARKIFEKIGVEVIIDSRLGAFHGTTVSGMSMRLFVKNLLYIPSTTFYGRKIYQRLNPDIVHLTSTCLFWHAKIIKSINHKIPVITHVREPLLDSIFGKILRFMNYKYVDAYIAIENYDLSKMNTKGKIAKVVHNFVDFDKYNSEVKSNILRKELNLDADSIVFLYLARISKSNGTLEFVKTINENELDDKYKFIVAGATSSDKHEYEKRVKKEIEKNSNIYIMGFRDDVPELIASSNVMVVPFSEPHFSRTVIEAAAMGVPSIVSDVKGLDELVVHNETGLIYELSNPFSLIEVIKLMGENEGFRDELGSKAEQRAKKLFESNTNARETFKVYEKLLDRN